MNNVVIPEKIYFMAPAMNPVALEIDNYKCNNINQYCSLNMKNGYPGYKPVIWNNGNANTQHIFHHIGNATAETGNTIQSTNHMQTFSPFHNFFN